MRPPRTDRETPGQLHVAYVGPIDFGSSSAPAQRMLGIVQALNAAGDRVSVGSGGYGKHAPASFPNPLLDVTALGELPNPGWPKLRRIARGLTWGAATRNWILKMDPAPDVILVYGTALGYLARLMALARLRRIPLIIDATEWYESSHLPGGKWGPFAMANNLSMRWLACKADGVIAISRYLENHFNGKGVATLRVPPLFAIELNPAAGAIPDKPLALCYVGSPGQKDRQVIHNLIQLPRALGCDRKQLRIHIVGVDKMEVIALLGHQAMSDVEHESLVFHGRLTSSGAREVIANSHYSVLQRGRERYAQAGYPSKVPESLLLGTPVMSNLTSNIGDVLVDGRNACILPDVSLDSLISKALTELSSSYRYDRNKIAAEASAKFSPRNHANALHVFLAASCSRRKK